MMIVKFMSKLTAVTITKRMIKKRKNVIVTNAIKDIIMKRDLITNFLIMNWTFQYLLNTKLIIFLVSTLV
ncbi:hypothetical protein CN397_08460 [Priestia megaterium]|nr:hypothetical protein CN397_08460 [Priestia megaterium]PFQ79875.1 hypothetical protein COK11_20710 [Priestia megaterium]PFW42432.1 hypothetical protein COL17_27815 [Priestia megaterium]